MTLAESSDYLPLGLGRPQELCHFEPGVSPDNKRVGIIPRGTLIYIYLFIPDFIGDDSDSCTILREARERENSAGGRLSVAREIASMEELAPLRWRRPFFSQALGGYRVCVPTLSRKPKVVSPDILSAEEMGVPSSVILGMILGTNFLQSCSGGGRQAWLQSKVDQRKNLFLHHCRFGGA